MIFQQRHFHKADYHRPSRFLLTGVLLSIALLLSFVLPATGQHTKFPQGNQSWDSAYINGRLRLAFAFITRPGDFQQDLDSALIVVNALMEETKEIDNPVLHRRVLQHVGRIHMWRKEYETGRDILLPLADEFARSKDTLWWARTIHYYALALPGSKPYFDSIAHLYRKASILYGYLPKYKEDQYETMARSYMYDRLAGRVDEAEQGYLSLIEPCKKYGVRYLTTIYRDLCRMNIMKGNFNTALHYGLLDLEELKRQNNTYTDVNIYIEIANLYNKLGDYATEMKWRKEIMALNKKLYPEYATLDLINYVQALLREGKLSEIEPLLKQCDKDYPPTISWQFVTQGISWAVYYHATHQEALAEQQFEKVLGYNSLANNLIYQTYQPAMNFFFDIGRYPRAREVALKFINTSPQFVAPDEKSETYNILFRTDSAVGDYQSALQHLALHKRMSDSLQFVVKSAQIADILTKYETEKKDNALQLMERDVNLKNSELLLKQQNIELLQRDAALQKSLVIQRQKDIQLKEQSINMLRQQAALDSLAGEKKDLDLSAQKQHVTYLQQQAAIQQSFLREEKLQKRITFAGIIVLLLVATLLLRSYRMKQAANKRINQQNNELSGLLTEKEWLLKEVHHRVKNNLHTVLSLLELQSAHLQNDALNAIRESQNRIYSMSLIHKKLYQSEDVATINMESYLHELLECLSDSLDNGQHIRFKLECVPAELDVSQAVPIGLIINEAVTNSFKYAFPHEQPEALINVRLEKGAGCQLVLRITDNGIGLPSSGNGPMKEGLGMSLIRGLADDLNGILQIGSRNGTFITLAFVPNTPFNKSKTARAHVRGAAIAS